MRDACSWERRELWSFQLVAQGWLLLAAELGRWHCRMEKL